MTLRIPTLKLPQSVSFSVALHIAVFAVVLWTGGESSRSPLPIGVELQYGTSLESSGAEEVKPQAKPAPAPKVQVAQNDSDAPALENKKEEAKPVVASAPTEKFGRADGVAEKGSVVGRLGVANGSEVSAEERYLYELRRLLERKKLYPVMAKRLGQTGKVTVKFTLAQDGSLLNSEVVGKAAHDSLNNAAQELVKSIHGVKPFPEEIHRVSWEITVPIEYMLN